MIENIGSIKNEISVLVNNLVKQTEVKVPQKEEIEDVYEGTKPAEKYSTYNKKGEVPQNHTVLPERYDKNCLAGYIYYKGERITQLELLEKAVDMWAIELEENETIGYNYDKAWKALVEANAKPLYSWSKGLYSEDGMYKFRVEDGQITGMTLARNADGVFYSEIVNDLANGTKPCDMGDSILGLAHLDPELYQAACAIGSAKRMYDVSDDRSLFEILFGFKVEDNPKDFASLALKNFDFNRYNNFFSKVL